jgi:hypothetical protein
MESLTNSLSFARTHSRSPYTATIHRKTSKVGERGITWLSYLPLSSEKRRWRHTLQTNPSHPPPMSRQKPQVSGGSVRNWRRAAACRPCCQDDGAPPTGRSSQRQGTPCNWTSYLPEYHKHNHLVVKTSNV